jgi:hypothetical protein
MPISSIINYINDRALYWQRHYNLYSVIEPQRAGLYKVMINTYNNLLSQIELIISEAKMATGIVKQAEAFFGKENLKNFIKS